MASIPVLSRPTVRQTPEQSRLAVNPAQQVGVALQQASGAVNEFARELNRLNEIRVNEALDKYAGEADGLQQELLTKQGTKAAEGLDPFRDKLTIARGNIEAELGNDDQRALFALRSERYSRDADRRAFGHVQGETRRVDVESFKSLNTRDMERIATEARQGADPTAVIAEMDRRVALFGDRQGWSPEMIANARAQAVSGARAAQLTAMANTENPDVIARAREIFAAEQGAMTQKDRDDVRAELEQGTTKSQSAAQEARIIALHPTDEKAALAAARAIENVDVRDATVNRLLARYSQNHAVEQRADTSALESAMSKVERTGDTSTLSASELATLRRRGWYESVQGRAVQVRNGNPPVSEMNALEEIYRAANDGTIKDIVPLTYRSRLNDRDYRMLLDSIEKATAGSGSGPAITQEHIDRYTFSGARRLGLVDVATAGELKGDLAKPFELLREEVAVEVDRMEADLKRKLSVPELEAAVNRTLFARAMFHRNEDAPNAPRAPFAALAPPASLRNIPPLRPNLTRADRGARSLELLAAGMSPTEAMAQVLREIP